MPDEPNNDVQTSDTPHFDTFAKRNIEPPKHNDEMLPSDEEPLPNLSNESAFDLNLASDTTQSSISSMKNPDENSDLPTKSPYLSDQKQSESFTQSDKSGSKKKLMIYLIIISLVLIGSLAFVYFQYLR